MVALEVDQMTLGEQIARLRREREWTQDQFAEKVGVHSRHVSRWETDKNRPAARALEKIAEVLGVDWESLATQREPQSATHVLHHEGLLRQFQAVQELEEEDQLTISRVIDAFVTKSRIDKVLHPVK
jgi:transcriptional regulator with XRE-family HTH domain